MEKKSQIVEVRIHGVGGEPPSSLLDDPHPLLVAGDQISGFYVPHRVQSSAPLKESGKCPLDIEERSRQALAWGGNTSGSWKNALWILLLPFALVNVSGYMHRPGGVPNRRVRWLSLTLTLSTVALAAGTAYDLIAIQCGSSPGCVERVKWLAPYAWKLSNVNLFFNNPTRRLGVATLLPIGLLTLLWFAGRYAYKDLESYLNRRLHDETDPGEGLMTRGFWDGYETSFRARLIHLAAGRTLIAGGLAWAMFNLPDPNASKGPSGLIGIGAGLLLSGCFIVCVLPVVYRKGANGMLKFVLACLQIASWVLLGTALGISAAMDSPFEGTLRIAALVLMAFALVKAFLAAEEVKRPVAGSASYGVDEPSEAPKHKRASPFSLVPFLGGLLFGIAWFPGGPVAEADLNSAGMLSRLYGAPYYVAWGIGILQLFLVLALTVGRFYPKNQRRRRDWVPSGPHWKPGDLDHSPLHGRGSAVFGVLAVFIILAAAAGVHRGIANLVALDPQSRASLPPESAGQVKPGANAVTLSSESGVGLFGDPPQLIQATIPWWYETTAHVAVLLAIGLVVAGWLFNRGLRRKPTDDQLEEVKAHVSMDPDFGIEPPIHIQHPDDRNRLTRVFQNWGLSRQLVQLDKKVFWVTSVVAVLGLFLLFFQAPKGIAALDDRRRWLPQDMIGKPIGFASTVSLWLVGLLPLLAVLLLRGAAQKEQWRRQIGRIWDVLMFWPRNIQPFAPPCYAERVVPQLRLHIDRLHADDHGVVVAGHSQGSVIAAAALAMGPLPDGVENAPEGNSDTTAVAKAQPDPEGSLGGKKLDLVVYGSPLSILYERYFPAYFGEQFFDKVDREADRWHHVFARTDVFAFPFWEQRPSDITGSCGLCRFPEPDPGASGDGRKHTDYTVVDPFLWDWWTKEPPRPPIRGHSAYATGFHERFEEHLKAIARKAYGVR